MVEQIILFTLLAGYIIGLGAVTVIDLHGFLGRKSAYWTRATIQTHKVTKPLIWIGTILSLTGSVLFWNLYSFPDVSRFHLSIFLILITNGIFLSFWLSPRLIKREKEGLAESILPKSWQNMVASSLVVSFLGWWGSLYLLVNFIVLNLN